MTYRESTWWECIGLIVLTSLAVAILNNGKLFAEKEKMALTLTSTAFREGEVIPSQYTCDGKGVSPPLAWTDPPSDAKSFALINDDPDAPMGAWVHWVVYNIPSALHSLPEALPTQAKLSDGTRQGRTDFGRTGYGGPCPPSGTHRYFFKLYALDATLDLAAEATKAQLEEAMKGHIVAQTQLVGSYRRKGR